jgi:hypothetical protein
MWCRRLREHEDSLIARNHQISSFEAATPRAVLNLQNWTNGTGCIARQETEYLNWSNDLLCVISTDDTVMTWLEAFVEHILNRVSQLFRKVRDYIET